MKYKYIQKLCGDLKLYTEGDMPIRLLPEESAQIFNATKPFTKTVIQNKGPQPVFLTLDRGEVNAKCEHGKSNLTMMEEN